MHGSPDGARRAASPAAGIREECAPLNTPMSTTAPLDEPLIAPGRRSHLFVYVAFIFPAFAGFLFGYDIGGTSGAVHSLSILAKQTAGVTLSTLEVALYTSASRNVRRYRSLDSCGAVPSCPHPLTCPRRRLASRLSNFTTHTVTGALGGSILVFWIGEPLGRRREIMCGSVLFMLGSLISGLGDASPRSVIAGRAIYGLGIALSMHAAPVYISEIAPAEKRGLLVSLKEGFIVLGILAGFAGTALAEATIAPASVYRAVWLPAAALGVVIFIGMSHLPPSPRWLLLRGASRLTAAAALRRFRRGLPEEIVQAELSQIEATMARADDAADAAADGGTSVGGWAEMMRSRRALVAGIGLIALQQLTGQPSCARHRPTTEPPIPTPTPTATACCGAPRWSPRRRSDTSLRATTTSSAPRALTCSQPCSQPCPRPALCLAPLPSTHPNPLCLRRTPSPLLASVLACGAAAAYSTTRRPSSSTPASRAPRPVPPSSSVPRSWLPPSSPSPTSIASDGAPSFSLGLP